LHAVCQDSKSRGIVDLKMLFMVAVAVAAVAVVEAVAMVAVAVRNGACKVTVCPIAVAVVVQKPRSMARGLATA
jgi:hypothetical protein